MIAIWNSFRLDRYLAFWRILIAIEIDNYRVYNSIPIAIGMKRLGSSPFWKNTTCGRSVDMRPPA